MPANIPNNFEPEDMFFETNCLNINPSQISKQITNSNSNKLSILNINIRSVPKNFNMLLSLLSISKIQYTVIVLTETWLKDSDDSLYNITGYSHISLNRKNGHKGGGVRIYFSTAIKLITIDNNLTGIFDSHECLSCELALDKKQKLHIIGIYRPPKCNIKKFNKHLKTNKISKNNSNSDIIKIIIGDMNIPYFANNIHNSRDQTEYFDLFISNLFKFHITKPTRLGKNGTNDSIIDHIWSNYFSESQSFTVNYKISDHLPNLVILDYNICSKPSKSIFFNFNENNVTKFLKNKANEFYHLMKMEFNDSGSTEYCWNEIMRITKKYFPIKTKQTSTKKRSAPWLTKNMRDCINTKHKLYKLYKSYKLDYNIYLMFSNILRKTITLARNLHERKSFANLAGNTRGIWKRINTLMRPRVISDPPFITDLNKITHNENDQISKAFIQFYTEAPSELIKKYLKLLQTIARILNSTRIQ